MMYSDDDTTSANEKTGKAFRLMSVHQPMTGGVASTNLAIPALA